MKEFLVITSDHSQSGRGVCGSNLYWFLRTFYGSNQVELATPENLLDNSFRSVKVVFAGVPTRLSKKHLRRVRYSELVLFDYHDTPGMYWEYSDSEFLLGLTDRYWKPAVEETWAGVNRVRWGCLPLRRSATLSFLLRVQAARNATIGRPSRRFNIGFVGFPTALHKQGPNGEQIFYPQRVEWLFELQQELPKYTFWGGLLLNSMWKNILEKQYGDLSAVEFGHRRMSYWRYVQALQSCQVLLTPAGNARWTYRHYEAAYAGAVLLSTDLSKTRLLAPLPPSNLVMVPDHASIAPYLDQALALSEDTATLQQGIDELERCFHFGNYSRKKQLVLERFLQQLEQCPAQSPQPNVKRAA